MRLYQGDYARETVFSEDPVAVAVEWERLGASRLHVVDLDGALQGSPANETVIRAIVRAVRIPVQAGGGIRDLAAVDRMISLGAGRVVLGTAAVEHPSVVQAACTWYPDAVVVALDARNGAVAIKGWIEDTNLNAVDLARSMAGAGVPRFLYTDIARDGTETEPNFDALSDMVRSAGRPVIASGGVASLAHLSRLKELGAEAAIVGRALYTGAIDLPAAVEALRC